MKPEKAINILQKRIDLIKQDWPHMPDLVEYQKTLERAVKALEKQIPRKVNNLSEIYFDFGVGKKIKVGVYGNCPNCNYIIDIVSKYCTRCGQKLDWGEEDEEKKYQNSKRFL